MQWRTGCASLMVSHPHQVSVIAGALANKDVDLHSRDMCAALILDLRDLVRWWVLCMGVASYAHFGMCVCLHASNCTDAVSEAAIQPVPSPLWGRKVGGCRLLILLLVHRQKERESGQLFPKPSLTESHVPSWAEQHRHDYHHLELVHVVCLVTTH